MKLYHFTQRSSHRSTLVHHGTVGSHGRGLSVYFFKHSCSFTNQAGLTRIFWAPPSGHLQFNCLTYLTWCFQFQSRVQPICHPCEQFLQAFTFKNAVFNIVFVIVTIWCVLFTPPRTGVACRVLDSRGGRSSSYVHLWNCRYEGYLLLLGQCHNTPTHTHIHSWHLASTACLADPEAERRPSR